MKNIKYLNIEELVKSWINKKINLRIEKMNQKIV